ncbi:MAG: peptidylprolyl isomerase [Paracoccaceae bacterium]
MPKITNIFTPFAIVCALALPASAQDVTSDTIVATVNGTDITIGHMIVLRENLPEQYKNLEDTVLFDGILEQVIQQTVLAQTIDAPALAVALQLENERRALLAGAAMGELLISAASQDAISAAYQEQYVSAEPNPEYNASHILVKTEAEALALVTELEAGADFASLAAEHSTGPSGPNGGKLGWFGPGMMVPAFEEAVTKLEAGDVSQPVQTQFGWHVIILNEFRLESPPALDEVRADIVEEIQQKAVTVVVESLMDKAEIIRPDLSEIDPAILRNTGLVLN